MVRLLVLFSTRPRSSLVNQTTSFFSCFSVPTDFFGDIFDAEFLLTLKISRL